MLWRCSRSSRATRHRVIAFDARMAIQLRHRRRLGWLIGALALVASCGEPMPAAPPPAPGAMIPLAPVTPVAAAIQRGALPLAIDDHGLPRLLRGTPAVPPVIAADPTTAARLHVERLAPAWGVAAGALPELVAAGEVPVPGGTIVRLRQQL